MLKKETLKQIATLLKIKEDDFEKAIKDSNEVDIVIDDKLTTFTEEEQTTLKKNSYEEGKKAGVEMEIKSAKEKHGLEFQGKSIDGLLEAKGKKVLADAKIEPSEKVKELEGKIKILETTVANQDKKLADKETEVAGIRTNSELYRHIPLADEKGVQYTQDEVIGLMKINGYDFKTKDGKTIATKSGADLVDKVGNPIPVKDVVQGFMKEKKYITEKTPDGGRGGGDKNPPTAFGKLSELKKSFETQGKSLLGEEFNKAVQDAVKADTNFDMAN